MLLRRTAYDMPALFRAVTQRSEERRQTPWRTKVRWLYQAVIAATSDEVAGLPLQHGRKDTANRGGTSDNSETWRAGARST